MEIFGLRRKNFFATDVLLFQTFLCPNQESQSVLTGCQTANWKIWPLFFYCRLFRYYSLSNSSFFPNAHGPSMEMDKFFSAVKRNFLVTFLSNGCHSQMIWDIEMKSKWSSEYQTFIKWTKLIDVSNHRWVKNVQRWYVVKVCGIGKNQEIFPWV